MKTLANLIATTVVLAIIGALLYGAYLGSIELWSVLSALSFETRTVLLFVAAIALNIGLLANLPRKKIEKIANSVTNMRK